MARGGTLSKHEKHPVFGAVHYTLGTAMRAAMPQDWPSRPHLGGPIPKVPALEQVQLALTLAAEERELVPADHRAALDRALKLARACLAKDRTDTYTLLDETSKKLGKLDFRLALGKATVAAVRTLLKGKVDLVGGILSGGYSAAVLALAYGAADVFARSTPRHGAKVKPFLERLDAGLLAGELDGVLRERELRHSKVHRVLARPVDSSGKIEAFVASFDGGAWGLLVKLKNRWSWTEGERDAVLATLPDALFKKVVPSLPAV